ncbi:hypothetical protein BU23DRAFT_594387 [Bimuria novae-zelandiae CBS 107.79]|uniref:Uncharacterized protein n=1 Tax=Bimuria novae-zelandiae CBS 107.79 TaxID=1447943 RepID=A0A6A5VTW8_9PLEO|nr:hypothetical protein BU23DRAFT_594387 [Bimuria novae-zelandiae CBS 107.79]
MPRSDRGDAGKRRGDGHPPWVTDDDQMASSSLTATAHRPIPTDEDDNNDHSYGPPSLVTWGKPSSIPPWSPPWELPWFSSIYARPDTLVTSTASTTSSHAVYQGMPTATSVASVSEILPSATVSATVAPGFGGSIGDTERKQDSESNVGVYAAAGVVPVFMICIIGFGVFFCLQRRRKQRQIAAAQANVQEMKFQQPTVQAYAAPPVPVLRGLPSYAAPPNDTQAPASLPPVILGPISAGSDGSYMTGIDTSEVLSTRSERTGLGDPFADGNSLLEEPPPPYKPRSIVSHKSSLGMPRSSLSMSSQHSGASQRSRVPPLRNPFEDPREDDNAVSQMSGSTLNRNQDNVSAVSDLSH